MVEYGNFRLEILMDTLGNPIIKLNKGSKTILEESFYTTRNIFALLEIAMKEFLEIPEMLEFFKQNNHSYFEDSPDFSGDRYIINLIKKSNKKGKKPS